MLNWIKRKLGLVRLEERVLALEHMLSRAEVKDEAMVVAEWKAAMKALPEGSPKWIAYKNRLASLGHRHGE